MDLKEIEVPEEALDRHWYYRSKAAMMARHLRAAVPEGPREVLDVGAGIGWFSRWMLERGLCAAATCVDPGYPADSRTEIDGRPLEKVRAIGRSGADTVLMMDVLEHVDDDVALLGEYLEKTAPGTLFFITVPAFEFLWSGHDEFLEHRRRYTLKSLRRTVERAGARPEILHYYFGAIFPAAAAVRLATRARRADRSDMKPQPAVLNAALRAVCAAEMRVMRFNRLAGLTAVCLCRR